MAPEIPAPQSIPRPPTDERRAVFQKRISAIVGDDHVRGPSFLESYRGKLVGLVLCPANEAEVAAILASANDAGVAVAPAGGGTKLDWGNPPSALGIGLSTERLNSVLEHAWADMTVTVEAGCTIASLQATLAQQGQRLAIDPLWPDRATVGGIVATNDSGALRLRFGALRDLIIGVTLALSDGTLARSGGKVVKNVAGYDLPKLATGALGTLGVLTQATFRLHPLPEHTLTLSGPVGTADEAQRLILAIADAQLAHSALQLRSMDDGLSIDVLLEGTVAGIAAQARTIQTLASQNLARPNLAESELANAFQRTGARADGDVWTAREALFGEEDDGAVVVKLSLLPTDVSWLLTSLADLEERSKVHSRLVFQATGLALARLEGEDAVLRDATIHLRADLESRGGSLVILRWPELLLQRIDAWGAIGDAAPLMRAVKTRLDPHGILDPGRFVAGI